jgi:hypothetical protein
VAILNPEHLLEQADRLIVVPALANQQLAAVDALLASYHMRLTIQKSAIPYLPK